jgi:hypothetical protein
MGRQAVRRIAAMWAGALLASGIVPCSLAAQSPSDRAAWDAMILSPVGALAPLARNVGDDDSRQGNVWLRYGRWRRDVHDAIHNNIGITVFQQVPFASSELSVTGAYLSLSCHACPTWISGGASLQSTLWQQGDLDDSSASIGSVGLRVDVGGAHYRGEYQTTAASTTSALVLGVGQSFIGQSHISASISPGIGVGRIALIDGIHTGVRRTLGAALAWTHSSGVAVNLGMQRIEIAGGPTQVGLGVGWRRQ